ncbi:hypothetical protein [Niabella sp.]|uniref:hypothetical protein n=1 Tax=Niabella sp. TaxID=1962976 RepID=UPI00260C9917|nr:hypothetical protein [Niabella sp.]
MHYKKLLQAALMLLLLGCKKDPENRKEPPAQMIYTDFTSQPVLIREGTPAFELDIDGDGTKDFAFKGQHVQEPEHSYTFIYVDPLTEQAHQQAITTQACAFTPNASIRLQIETGSTHYWSNSRGILTETEHFPDRQERDGQFIGAAPGYLAVKVKRGGNTYLGWIALRHQVEAGIDRIYILRAAISKQPDTAVIAGV